MSPTLFISDLHLSHERPALAALFLNFLHGRAPQAEALYILGDLFEVWLGDDAIHPAYQPILAALRALADSGVPVYVMHGNRDFLLATGFERASGCRLIADPALIELHGERTLLMHGHSHRPAIHEFVLDGHPARRIVLGDWYEQGSVLTCDAAGCRLEGLS